MYILFNLLVKIIFVVRSVGLLLLISDRKTICSQIGGLFAADIG